MPDRMRRVQILLPEEEHERLQELARERRRSVAGLVREAVAACYPAPPSRRTRMAAVRRMMKMEFPVADWPQMEEEIIRGFLRDE